MIPGSPNYRRVHHSRRARSRCDRPCHQPRGRLRGGIARGGCRLARKTKTRRASRRSTIRTGSGLISTRISVSQLVRHRDAVVSGGYQYTRRDIEWRKATPMGGGAFSTTWVTRSNWCPSSASFDTTNDPAAGLFTTANCGRSPGNYHAGAVLLLTGRVGV
jgi:hypothetical protein